MYEIALQIVLNLLVALIIGFLIGYFIGKRTKDSSSTEDIKKEDNLKKIRGINSTIEKGLKGLGIDTFMKISKLTELECDDIGKSLNCADLIKDLKWVEQAKILASGEETIYSLKVEKKEIIIG